MLQYVPAHLALCEYVASYVVLVVLLVEVQALVLLLGESGCELQQLRRSMLMLKKARSGSGKGKKKEYRQRGVYPPVVAAVWEYRKNAPAAGAAACPNPPQTQFRCAGYMCLRGYCTFGSQHVTMRRIQHWKTGVYLGYSQHLTVWRHLVMVTALLHLMCKLTVSYKYTGARL